MNLNVWLRLVITVLSFGVACSVNAAPLVWTLENVFFNDGTSVNGSLTYDATTNVLSDFSVTTQDGLLSGRTYNPVSAFPFPDTGTIGNFNVLHLEWNDWSSYVVFFFDGVLSNAGGTVALLGGISPLLSPTEVNPAAYNSTTWLTSWELSSTLQANGSQTVDNWRWIVSGDVTASSSVPEPGSLALFGIGLAGLSLASRRKKQVLKLSAL